MTGQLWIWFRIEAKSEQASRWTERKTNPFDKIYQVEQETQLLQLRN